MGSYGNLFYPKPGPDKEPICGRWCSSAAAEATPQTTGVRPSEALPLLLPPQRHTLPLIRGLPAAPSVCSLSAAALGVQLSLSPYGVSPSPHS